jgi:hypothetical protein
MAMHTILPPGQMASHESLKAVAPMRGFAACQTLLKSYNTTGKLTEALKRRGVAEKVLQEAMAEVASNS